MLPVYGWYPGLVYPAKKAVLGNRSIRGMYAIDKDLKVV